MLKSITSPTPFGLSLSKPVLSACKAVEGPSLPCSGTTKVREDFDRLSPNGSFNCSKQGRL